MSAEIKGWCPGAHRPMMSGDGLVVRVRPPFGRLSVEQTQGLGDLAVQFGNGEVAVTSRLNLQIRGVAEADFGLLFNGLSVLGLVDQTPEAEARGNIVLAPFRHDEAAQSMAMQIAEGLSARLTLPSKFGIVIDIEPKGRQLAEVSGDIRLERSSDGVIVRADGLAKGRSAADPVTAAMELVDWFFAHGVRPDGRGRMRQVSDQLDDCWRKVAPLHTVEAMVPGLHENGFVIAGAFGSIPAWMFQEAEHEIIVLPNRLLMLLGAKTAPKGVISKADDPLLIVTACVGAPACGQGQAETRSLAEKLGGVPVHVSGCDKGCMHPGKSAITLVGRSGRFDLVKNGRASDTPMKRGLSPEDILKELGRI